MLNIALIGLGIMGKNHLNELLKTNHKLYLYDIVKPNFLNDNSDKYIFFNDLQELLKNKIDGCIIAVPTRFHKEVFLQVHKKVKNILLEKPIALNLKEANEIKENATNNNVFIGFSERFNPSVLELLKYIKNEKIKSMDFFRASLYPNRINDVGVGLDIAVHDIDIANLFGFKDEFHVIKFKQNENGIFEDEVKLVAKNKPLVIQSSWNYHTKIRKAIINTDKNTYIADLLNKELYKNDIKININNKLSSLELEHLEFFNFIKGKITHDQTILANINDGIHAIKPFMND